MEDMPTILCLIDLHGILLNIVIKVVWFSSWKSLFGQRTGVPTAQRNTARAFQGEEGGSPGFLSITLIHEDDKDLQVGYRLLDTSVLYLLLFLLKEPALSSKALKIST